MQSMMRTFVPALLLLTIFALPVSADEAKINAGVQAAEAWLAIVDQGDYAMSWMESAPLFQGVVDMESWVATLKGVRTPLGALVSRNLVTSEYATTLPGAPDGEYVVMTFDTGFAQKRSSVETVTVMLDVNGVWRLAGYYIK